jgi:hypothetical protein
VTEQIQNEKNQTKKTLTTQEILAKEMSDKVNDLNSAILDSNM